MVASLHQEHDGGFGDGPSYWCYLKSGYVSPEMECGSIHEPTIKAVCELLNNARRLTVAEIEEGYMTTASLAECRQSWNEVKL
jgi:hypothetical protein